MAPNYSSNVVTDLQKSHLVCSIQIKLALQTPSFLMSSSMTVIYLVTLAEELFKGNAGM